ncbi:hypothetical protein K501DRAFT_334665 [Backusella circina FSU 941]|nr:hypothetical protein K501DRAFT_334665 [Backusella circina FSU 941]
MLSKQRPPAPKALNIVHPTSAFPVQDVSHSSSTASDSTLSTLSTHSGTRVQPTIVSPSNFAYFQHNWSIKTNPIPNTVGVNPHRFLQRPRSNSSLSKSTFVSLLSAVSSDTADDDEEEEDEYDDEYDLDSIDGITDDEEEDEEEQASPAKIVAKVKHGTIMNGKGEFLSKGPAELLDEARANRKIADLEIEKTSLLALNKTLEAKLRDQAALIVELQKRLETNEGPLTPVSDKHVEESALFAISATPEEEAENDQVFERIRTMLENLILQAEMALIQKSKASGKVLQDYDYEKQHHVQAAFNKLSMRSPSPQQQQRTPLRRVSDAEKKPRPSSAKMKRSLSRQSSPPVLQRPATPPLSQRPFSPPFHTSTPRQSSNLRKSQEFEKPKWHF